ncbi:MAG: SHOCT domain-containing protein [Actinobacteria bacterium]|nr:MAG: SHOCT domain-containing protein [Actinomycetota bacterium]
MPAPIRLRRTSIAITVLASVVAFFAVFAVWAQRQLLESDTWTQTSTKLLADERVQTALDDFLVQALFDNVDVQAQLSKALPDNIQGLAGPAASGVRELALRAAAEALKSPQVQDLWAKANLRAHETFLQIVEGGNATVSTSGGLVTLDLGRLITQVGDTAGVDLHGKIQPGEVQIVILRSDQLGFVQDMVNVLRQLSLALPALAIALFALAIYLPRGRRREAVRAAGIAFICVGVAVLVTRSVAGGIIVNELAKTEAVRPAADAVWGIFTTLLRDQAVAMIAYGALIVVGAWLAGRTATAREIRRAMTPVLERRAWGYPALAIIVLLVFWWSPTEGTSRLIPSLVLIALFIVGFEALRHQAMRDFPDETAEQALDRWKERFTGLRARMRRRREAPEEAQEAVATDVRLEALERLARLRDSGVLDGDEFAREKERILAS